jgi:hypothetical protein
MEVTAEGLAVLRLAVQAAHGYRSMDAAVVADARND